MTSSGRGSRGSAIVLDGAILVVAAAVAAIAVNLGRPSPLAWSESWSHRVEIQAAELGVRVADTDGARALIDDGTVFVFDARPEDQFAEGHLPLALPLPSDTFDDRFIDYAGMLIPEQEILVYCSGVVCDESLQVCRSLLDHGFTNLVLFAGGFEAWEAAGHPMEAGL